jgi:hypothetical protein
MNKRRVTKRLSLTKDTLRLLEKSDLPENDLRAVAGMSGVCHTPTYCGSRVVCC